MLHQLVVSVRRVVSIGEGLRELGTIEDNGVSGSRGDGSDGVGDAGSVELEGSVSEIVDFVANTELTTLVGAEGHNARKAVIISVNMSCSCIVDIHCNTGPF
jgi:hypothetical protein